MDGPNPVSARRTGHRYHLGDNEEVFDAEVFAIYQVLRTFEAQNEEGRVHGLLRFHRRLKPAQCHEISRVLLLQGVLLGARA